jgi:alpha-amylase
MMQYFHWYSESGGKLWNEVTSKSSQLADTGITALWLPPAYKGQNGWDVGYGVYDMYDLGEFYQKGTVATKYGTKAEYLRAIDTAHNNGINIYGDVVFNHRGGAEATEWVEADMIEKGNRNHVVSTRWIEAYTKFEFKGRGDKYSNFKWRWYHFDGVDWDKEWNERKKWDLNPDGSSKHIYRLKGEGKGWDWEVDTENSNYDYLMYCDLDFDHSEVREHLKDWGEWYLNTTNVDGFRIDAVKHIKFDYIREWISHMRWKTGKELFTVGEYWNYEVEKLHHYITKTAGTVSLFDAPLHMNFYNASRGGGHYDMRKIMDNTLMQQQPAKAVTIVENHDTQPLQALESPVDWWFKPLAYAFILLRQEGYPCVFYADYYGANYTDWGKDGKKHTINMVAVSKLDKLIKARKLYAYGNQNTYMDHHDIIGWTREGDSKHQSAMAVLMSDGPGGSKWMYTGKANTKFVDYLGNRSDEVWTNSDGWGEFKCNGGSVSVWVNDAGKKPYDVAGHWSEIEVRYMVDNGYMTGYSDGTFRPDRDLTRAEFATMLVAVLKPQEKSEYSSRSFTDISNHWAKGNILRAARSGYIAGYTDGTFRPEEKVTKLQALLAISNGLGLSGGNTSTLSNYYADHYNIPNWAKQSIANATRNNMVVNYPNKRYLNSNNNAKRAEVVNILYRALVRQGKAPSYNNSYLVKY